MLKNQVAVVTGSSRGIGAVIVKTFAKEGARVIINYQGSKDRALALVDEIHAAGGEAEAVKCDVSDFKACEGFLTEVIKSYGRIDILVNNAGITRDNLLMKMSEAEFDEVISVNLKAAFSCMKFVSRQMLKQKSGRIINISSVVGLSGNAGQTNYAASKAGVIGMTKAAAKELASRGITVNAIAPGMIATDMTEVLSENIKEAMLQQIPMRRFGRPEDVAAAALFLAGPHASYMTGQVITVDGGMVM